MRNSTIALLASGLLLAAACGGGDDDAEADAFVIFDAPSYDAQPDPPDAAPVTCTEPGFTAGGTLTGGALADLFGAGPGAWVGHNADHAAPGEILYIEAYENFFTGTQVVYTEFKDWASECDICVFFGTGCDPYQINLQASGAPEIPIPCTNVFMLERGQIDLTAFDTTPASGALAGTIIPTGSDTSVRFVEVGIGEADYGDLKAGGGCVEVPTLAFDTDLGGGDGDGDGDGNE